MTNICKSCKYWERKDKTSEEYERWKADHKCSTNHPGSANSMEAVGAVRMFSRCELKNGHRYTKFLGDGDSSSFKTVRDSKPYGDLEIEKLECVGHVQKRCGGRLRKLKQSWKGKGNSIRWKGVVRKRQTY